MSDELSGLRSQVTALRRINQALLRGRSEPELLQQICDLLREIGCVDVVWIGLLDESGSRLELVAQAGLKEDFPSFTSALREITLASCGPNCLAIPLTRGGKIIGSMNVCPRNDATFGDDEAALLTEIAGDIATRLTTLRLEKQLERNVEKLQRTLAGTIQAMELTVEKRDPYTAGHQRRVAKLAHAIAGKMGLPEEQASGILMIAGIHDVGKICVPAEILSKPARLSDIEFTLIKAHSQAGHDILETIEFPWPVADAVLQHHERIDGSGYPAGLAEDEILLEARIIGLADVVEAMVSHRPYRTALGIDEAMNEIKINRGVLYDSNVVDACLSLFEQKIFTLEA